MEQYEIRPVFERPDDEPTGYLVHYGVRGQKWGVRTKQYVKKGRRVSGAQTQWNAAISSGAGGSHGAPAKKRRVSKSITTLNRAKSGGKVKISSRNRKKYKDSLKIQSAVEKFTKKTRLGDDFKKKYGDSNSRYEQVSKLLERNKLEKKYTVKAYSPKKAEKLVEKTKNATRARAAVKQDNAEIRQITSMLKADKPSTKPKNDKAMPVKLQGGVKSTGKLRGEHKDLHSANRRRPLSTQRRNSGGSRRK